MTSTVPPTTPTTKPSAPSATASWASCTAACAATPPTTNTSPGHTACQRRLDNLLTWDLQKSCGSPFCVADSHTRWRMMADPPYQSTLRRTSVNARSHRRNALVGLGFRTRVIASPTLLPLPAVALRLLVAVPFGGR